MKTLILIIVAILCCTDVRADDNPPPCQVMSDGSMVCMMFNPNTGTWVPVVIPKPQE